MDGGSGSGSGSGGGDGGWNDSVEDLLDQGDVEGAIGVLESVVAKLETDEPPPPNGNLRLATALSDLADLHSSRGYSLKADELRSRALLFRARALCPPSPPTSGDLDPTKAKATEREESSVSALSDKQEEDEDDWEAIVDSGAANEVLLSSQDEAGAPSSTSSGYKEPEALRRRGRGSFLYGKSYLYSDQQNVGTTSDDTLGWEDEVDARGHRADAGMDGVKNSRYGTGHVLVLHNLPLSTRTTELEKLFEDFQDSGVAIRWVNDTVAVAVFRTPSVAQEAQSTVRCSFKVRALGEDDVLLSLLSPKDLEPPYPRPKTSARTAQRMIAQGMGIKLPTDFGSNELKKQEEARKNRISSRHTLKDDAWGSDEPQ